MTKGNNYFLRALSRFVGSSHTALLDEPCHLTTKDPLRLLDKSYTELPCQQLLKPVK